MIEVNLGIGGCALAYTTQEGYVQTQPERGCFMVLKECNKTVSHLLILRGLICADCVNSDWIIRLILVLFFLNLLKPSHRRNK